MTTLYHGTKSGQIECLEGICLTDDLSAARSYAGRDGEVYEVELSDLLIVECDDYDWDSNETPADDDDYRAEFAARGIDALRYQDADKRGLEHVCIRLISIRAVAMLAAAI